MIVVILLALAVSHIDAASTNSSKIVGGSVASTGQFPYAVTLLDSGRNFFCGGSILSERWIVTAAHCDAKKVKYIGLGSNYRNSQKLYAVEKTKVHEDFNLEALQNDIMLVKTVRTIPFNSNTAAIGYNTDPEADDVLYKNMAAAGWGIMLKILPITSNSLLWTTYRMQSQDTCVRMNDQSNQGLPYDPDLQICALGVPSFTQSGTCFGDSGGPLVVDNLLFGITSRLMVTRCGSGYPDVFTRISYYSDWIENVMST